MTIKIAHRTETTDHQTMHIAEAVTPNGDQLSYRQPVRADDLEKFGPIVEAAAKRHVLHGLIDDAIHRGLI